jgi:hypothetical protein
LIQRLFTGIGVAFLVLAAIVAVTGGLETSVAGVPISATSAARLLFEGAVLVLIGMLVAPKPRGIALVACIALFLVAAAADSEPRRVGDGFEYLGMARNLSRLAPPSLAEAEFDAITAEMASHGDTSWDSAPLRSLRGEDGRYDFPHFWLLSLVAAPLVGIAAAAGLHPAMGFTALNILLLLGATLLLVRRGAAMAAVAFAATMLWWVDKAHAEMFIAVTAGAGVLLLPTAPVVSLLLLGAAAAQMPVMAVLLAAGVVVAVLRERTGRIVAAAVVAAAIAALHPLYYLWRLGVTSPLRNTVIPHVPGVREVITPLVDLNLGVIWFAPVLCVLTIVGLALAARRREWAVMTVSLLGAITLLAAATQTPNVNHGGTPGMSRYGVWLLALLLPLAARGETGLRWPRGVPTLAICATVAFAAFVLPPRKLDSGVGPDPTQLARLVWTLAPTLDNPLPEVFTERVTHIDGIGARPVATDGCTKALVIARAGEEIKWPEGCVPRAIPPECEVPGTLCYASGGEFDVAPKQPGFVR